MEEVNFLSLNSKQKHMEEVHPNLLQKSFHCPICNKGFEKAWKADLHQRMVHHMGDSFRCTYEGCDYVAYRRYDLKDHERVSVNHKVLTKTEIVLHLFG